MDAVFWVGSFTTMDWDDATGQEYRMVGGYFLGPFEHGRGNYGPPVRPTASCSSTSWTTAQAAHITGTQRAAFRADLRYWRTAIVVLGPHAPHHAQLRYVLNQLTGQPARQVAGVLLWDVRALSGLAPAAHHAEDLPRRVA